MASAFLDEARARGFVFQVTDEAALDAAFAAGPVTAYHGIDCTADSLHVGHLMGLMALRLLQRHGHKPVVLLGGGTSRIGDPSFRDEARSLLTDDAIAANMAGIRACIGPLIRFGDGPSDAVQTNNADWLDRLGYIELLREAGPHFSVSRMLSYDSVRTRLEREQGLTFLEFNYSILQSYDFRELHRRHGVTLQLGGSDQWGNIVSGIDFVRRTDQATVYGLTWPLLATASGVKMGKTAKGAVWLSPDRLAPYDYWQFWRNTEDADVGRFLRLFTDLPLDEIARLEAVEGAAINGSKIVLANEATALAHGRAAADAAAETARRTFAGDGAGDGDLPTVHVTQAELETGIPLTKLLIAAGFAASNGEARRLIAGGGARINDGQVTDDKATITTGALVNNRIKISSGRKHHALIRVD